MVDVNAKKGMTLKPLSVAPTAVKGLMYFDNSSNSLKVCQDGSSFNDISGGIISSNIGFLENAIAIEETGTVHCVTKTDTNTYTSTATSSGSSVKTYTIKMSPGRHVIGVMVSLDCKNIEGSYYTYFRPVLTVKALGENTGTQNVIGSDSQQTTSGDEWETNHTIGVLGDMPYYASVMYAHYGIWQHPALSTEQNFDFNLEVWTTASGTAYVKNIKIYVYYINAPKVVEDTLGIITI